MFLENKNAIVFSKYKYKNKMQEQNYEYIQYIIIKNISNPYRKTMNFYNENRSTMDYDTHFKPL